MRPAALRAWMRRDRLNVGRDPLLVQLLVAPTALVVLLQLTDGGLGTWIARSTGVQVADYRPLLTSFLLLLLVPFLCGLLAGLVLLDERDEGVLPALRVTPLSLRGYALARAGASVVLSLATLLVAVPLSGSLPSGGLARTFPVLILAALFAPLPALLLAAVASNKVEGLAAMKATSLLFFTPLLAWFTDSRWALLLGAVPGYWPARAFWALSAGARAWPLVLAGLAYHAVLLGALWRLWERRATTGR